MEFLIHHMLRASSSRLPEKSALVHADERLSYADVWRRTSALAAALRKLGLKRGQRAGIYLEASIAQVVSIFSISMAGGVYVPINATLFPEQVQHIARDCGMTTLITSQARLQDLLPILKQISTLEFLIVISAEQISGLPVPVFYFDDLLIYEVPAMWSDHGISKDLAAILYTSGSTGRPKGVMLSHANVMAGSSIVSTYLEITDQDSILAVLPFSFDAGMNQLMTAFQQGSTLVLINFTLANEIISVLAKERITGLAGVPTLWSLLAQHHSKLKQTPLPHLRYITNTGGAMPQNVLATLREYLGTTKVFLMYGLTEAFRSTYLPPEELDRRPTSMGKAIPDTEILVLNENNQICTPDEVGELVHRGPTVSMGYWNQPEATHHVLKPNPLLPPELGDCERVCYSGDLVKKDAEGFLYYVGRRDTMIKSSGYRISPTEVEEIIFQSGWVRHAAVIGIPDEKLGQTIKAFVVPRNGETVDIAALTSFCSAKMPRYMIPKSIEMLVELPTTSSGKVDYPALRRREGL
jgi:acyl-CoA ligase (AMP-forming) (exosortase A-associated)